MSQENIDRLYAYLLEHPEEMSRVKDMVLKEIVSFAHEHGFEIEPEELKARQALVHLIHGT